MELLQLRYFQMVARLGNVTSAAKYFNIPQPAMSQAISRLEESLGGVKLFDRRGGRLYLNDVGKKFLDAVDESLKILDEGSSKVQNVQPGDISGSIRLKVMENQRLVLTSIPKFLKMYPNVNLSVSHGYYEDQDISYDICITSSASYKHMSWHVPLIRENLVLAVCKNHVLSEKLYIQAKDLKGEKLVSLPPGSKLYEATISFCKKEGFVPDIPIVCDDPYYVRKYVSENIGVALAPEISWRGRFRENTVIVPVKDSPVLTSYLVMDGNRFPTKTLATFRDFIISEAEKVDGNLLKSEYK